MTINEFNSVFSPNSECSEKRNLSNFTFYFSKENIIMEGMIPFSLLLQLRDESHDLLVDLDDFSSPKLDGALKRFNAFTEFSCDSHKYYTEQYDIYRKEVFEGIISNGDTDDLVLKKLTFPSDKSILDKIVSVIKLYYSE